MDAFDHIDYNAKINFDPARVEARLKTKAFKKHWMKVLKEADAFLQSSTKVDSQRLYDRFGS